VEMTGGAPTGAVGEKLENFTASFAATVAHQRGRNEAWIQDAVRKSSSVSDQQALKLHVVDIVAADVHDLLKQASGHTLKLADSRAVTLDVADAEVRSLTMRLGERVLNRLADPNVMYLLMLAGMIGLYFEFAHPGIYLPGVAGAICLLLALASFQVIPINLAGLMLVILGAAMLVAEIFIGSFGVLGIGGVIAFVLGSLFLVDTSETNLAINREIIAGAAVAFSAIILGIGYLVMHTRSNRARTGAEGLVGEVGEVREPIAPGAPGRVFVHGEIWRAVSVQPIAAGARVRVVAVRGLEVTVQPESVGLHGAARG
jgi:membrane-bound serine protease (ClpP class)